MYEDAGHVVVEANLPGVDPEAVDVTYDRGKLLIRAERESKKENQERNYYHKSMNSFAYNIEIPSNVDESKNPLAEYKNGLMTIKFEKSETSKPKKIKVEKK
jgi:HSP20 family protein